MAAKLSNWAGNYTFGAAEVRYPTTVEDVQQLVRQADKAKALGSRHSFNNIADSPEVLFSLERFESPHALDRKRRTITVHGGVRYGQICEWLHREGFALRNMASLPHISVAGACATATHGSGDANGNLSTAVAAMEVVTAGGEVIPLSRDQPGHQFQGAVVGLGGLGIVTSLTLDVVPAFDVRQFVRENLPLRQLEDHVDEIFSSAYSVSLFTDWRGERVNQVWLKRIVRDEDDSTFEARADFFGATLAPVRRHPIPGISAEACSEQMGIPGPWHERLPHFRMDHTPSSGEELQTEYLVPRHYAVAAIRAIHAIRGPVAPLLQISEVRSVAADDLWMSPCYRQACVGIHFTWKKDWEKVSKILPLIEAQLAPFDARPHWGKLFAMQPARVQALYPKLADFRQLLLAYDPGGKFRNAFLDTYIFGNQ